MDTVLLETPTEKGSPVFVPLSSPNYHAMMQESIDRFVVEAQRGCRDFSGLRSVLFRLLQSSADPPLEIVWFYSALSYHETDPSKNGALGRLSAIRNLLQLILACSAASVGLKCIALVAPALSELYRCFVEEEKALEKHKEVWKEIESLVDGILSHISICSASSGFRESSVDLLPCFMDLVRVWAMQQPGSGDCLGFIFPLVGDEIRDRFRDQKCDIGYLAGVVIAEAFLLRLCLKVVAGGASKLKLQKELRIWAISSITAFGNRVFFDILLRLLLDPTLSVTSFLNSEDENIVRDILYDSVILVDYSFLNSGMEVEQFYVSLKSLALTRLIVTHEAIRIARAKGDNDKAISYTNAFTTSCLPNGLIKLVCNQTSIERHSQPTTTTPQALIGWLVGLEDQGLRLFDDDLSRLRRNLIFDEFKVIPKEPIASSDMKRIDGDIFFFDKQGEGAEVSKDEEMEAMDTAFVSAARSMKPSASNGRRKRKEVQDEEVEARVKNVKYKIIHEISVKDYFLPSVADGASSGSEVDNPGSDDDMEETEQ